MMMRAIDPVGVGGGGAKAVTACRGRVFSHREAALVAAERKKNLPGRESGGIKHLGLSHLSVSPDAANDCV